MNTGIILPSLPVEHVQQAMMAWPTLPAALRYYDDFQDKYHSIRDLQGNDTWTVEHDGELKVIDFSFLKDAHRTGMKHVVADLFDRCDPSTVISYYGQITDILQRSAGTVLDCFLCLPPYEVRQLWTTQLQPNITRQEATALRAVLHSMCRLAFGHWTNGLSSYVSNLPGIRVDIYKTVRTGDCFVPMDQQAKLIDYFDELSITPGKAITKQLRASSALLLIYQHAFRPGQVARIKLPDVRVFENGAVHYRAPLTKQRDSVKRRYVNRRIKREWCPIFIEYLKRCPMPPRQGVPNDNLFAAKPHEIATMAQELLEAITGEDWSATDLRHTAAQRLVDAGASHAVVSEFMGHASTRTATIYIDTSPTQAQRVNQALGISPIYRAIAEIARTKTIDKDSLLRLPPDKQIGGVPHGIPIAGIGACQSGQSICTKNPVLSCYTCRKFLPVNDIERHREVTEGLRPVVMEFAKASRGNMESPAYVQLRRTLDGAERVIADLSSEDKADE